MHQSYVEVDLGTRFRAHEIIAAVISLVRLLIRYGRYRLVGVCPILVMREGKPVVAIGVEGGFNIVQTTPQMLINIMDFDMNIQQAIAAPRISFIEPDWIAVESGIPQPVRADLAALGHNVYVESELGNAHGLTVEYDAEGELARFTGGADPRAAGAAIGY